MLQENVGEAHVRESQFIRALITSVLTSSVEGE